MTYARNVLSGDTALNETVVRYVVLELSSGKKATCQLLICLNFLKATFSKCANEFTEGIKKIVRLMSSHCWTLKLSKDSTSSPSQDNNLLTTWALFVKNGTVWNKLTRLLSDALTYVINSLSLQFDWVRFFWVHFHQWPLPKYPLNKHET